MAGPTTRARATWVADRITALPEVWAIVALHLGLVGAWRLMLVCKAARVGATDFLNTLPGLVVCGGIRTAEVVNDVWRLDLATLRWEAMPALEVARVGHAWCAVRSKSLVVLGGHASSYDNDDVGEWFEEVVWSSRSVEMFAAGEVAFTHQPPLSCGRIDWAAAIAVDEIDSAAGQVLLLGGVSEDDEVVSTVYLVDLATGVCTTQPNLLHPRQQFAAARLPDGRIVCAGGYDSACRISTESSSVEVFEPPARGALDTAWTWRDLPAMSMARAGCGGCVLSDGRFAVLGGMDDDYEPLSACEALLVGDGEHWETLPSMHEARSKFACAAVAGCIMVAGGWGDRDLFGCPRRSTAEVFDEVLDRWFKLPCDLPYDDGFMGSALL